MNCQRFLDCLPDYVSEELSEEDRVSWRAHLAGCPECRARAAALEPTLVLLDGYGAPPPRDAVDRCVTGVLSRVRQESLERRLARRGRWWMAAAAAVVVACLGVTVWLTGEQSTPPTAPALVRQPPTVELEMGPDVVMYQVVDGPGDETVTAMIVNPALEL